MGDAEPVDEDFRYGQLAIEGRFITPDQFEQVPTYTAQQYPTFTAPAYRTQIYQAYGLTPGQQRRAIRRGGFVR